MFSSAVLRMVDLFLQNPWDAYVHVFSYIGIICPSHLHQYPIIIQYPINPIIQWIGLRENLQETIDFPIKYGVFL